MTSMHDDGSGVADHLAGFRIRRAEPQDAEAITAMHLRSWREAYSHLLPDGFFSKQETVHYEARVEARRRHLAENAGNPSGVRTWVGFDGRDVVAVASSGPARDADLAGEIPLELQMIYVLEQAQGTGLAKHLLQSAIGSEPSFLWVFRNNARAERFYRRNGFEPDGAVKQTGPGWGYLEEFRMVRR
ncbi:GNAT family N-acetyltransferase [Arthrobacter pigmenti]